MSFSSTIRSRAIPRCAAIMLALAGLFVLPGCWVYSVEPLYEENLGHPDPDLTFDQTLVGSWLNMDTDNDCLWTLVVAAEQQVYELTMVPASNCKGEEKTTRYEGHLLKLDKHLLLDVAPNSADVCDLCLRRHTFFLISQENHTLALIPVNDDWLNAAIAQKKVTLAHLVDDRGMREVTNDVTLTASSRDLKAFVRRYANDKVAFKPDSALVFKKK